MRKNGLDRRFPASAVLVAFLSFAFALFAIPKLWADSAALRPQLLAFDKLPPENEGTGAYVEPNVLLLIDTSASMLWISSADVNATIPVVQGRKFETAETACTYGDGTRGWDTDGNGSAEHGPYWGRDMDSSNNDPSDPDDYHPELIYRNTDNRSGGLIPNDSRAYKMKLVLWRLLNDGDAIGGVRLGLATYMQSQFRTSDPPLADWYRKPSGEASVTSNRGGSYRISCSYRYRQPGESYDRWWDGEYGLLNGVKLTGAGSYSEDVTVTNGHYALSYNLSRGVDVGDQDTKSKRALFLVDFREVADRQGIIDASSQQRFTRWIDGKEQYDYGYKTTWNPELRFDGKRPLAEAIANGDERKNLGTGTEGAREGSALDFFRARVGDDGSVGMDTSVRPKFVTEWCQKNYLIVLTAGGQTRYGGSISPDEAVRKLYAESPMSYTGSGGWGTEKSQPVQTIVIGFVDPNSNPDTVAMLDRMGDYGDDGVLNGSKGAYFAANVTDLLSTVRARLVEIRASAMTNNAPLLNRDSDGGNSIYTTSYRFQTDKQWRGEFKKYTISSSDRITWDWNAEDELNGTPADDRKIYTVKWADEGGTVPGWSGSGLRLFRSDSNGRGTCFVGEMRGDSSDVIVDDVYCGRLIDWIRGRKIPAAGWSEDFDSSDYAGRRAGEHWKLADIVHGGMVELGDTPTFSGTLRGWAQGTTEGRYRTVCVQSNLGMLHAFDFDSGREKWAFVPPNVLAGGRLAALKRASGTGAVYRGALGQKSNPLWLLDGPIRMEDVRIGTSDRTLLFGLLGRGGAGLYALDVTETERPKFLWAVESDAFTAQDGRGIPKTYRTSPIAFRWRADALAPAGVRLESDSTASAIAPYRSLGLATSTPTVGWILSGGARRDVALFGNGARLFASSDWEGKLLLADVTNGDVLTTFERTKGSGAEGYPSGNFVAPPLVLRTTAGQRQFRSFYAADDRGSLWSGDIRGGDLTNGTSFGEILRRGILNPKSGFAFSLSGQKIDSDVWMFGGTGTTEEGLVSGDLAVSGTTRHNLVIALNLSKMGSRVESATELDVVYPANGNNASGNRKGWYIPYDTPDGGKGTDPDWTGAKLSTPPTVAYREDWNRTPVLLFATYSPPSSTGTDRCASGVTHLFVLDATDGAARQSKRYVELRNLKISGIAVDRTGRVYIGFVDYKGTAKKEFSRAGLTSFSFPEAGSNQVLAVGNLFGPGGVDPSQTMPPPVSKGNKLIFWRSR